MQVKKKPAENPNWRIRDNQLYFFRPDPLKSSLDLDSNPWKLTIPKELREQVLKENHDNKQAGHLGMEKTYARIAQNYFWPGMYSETLKYVKECDTCQRIKPKINNQVGLLGKRIIEEPWTVVAADIVCPLPRSKSRNQYMLVFVDMFTKWVEIIPVKNKLATTIEKEFQRKIISKWGTPRILFTDNGKEFVNRIMVKLTQNFGIRHSKTPRYHPQSNPTERCNRSIKTAIKAYLEKDHKEWDKNLDDLQFALNTSKHASTGFTPAFLNFRRELEPIQTLNKDLINIEKIE